MIRSIFTLAFLSLGTLYSQPLFVPPDEECFNKREAIEQDKPTIGLDEVLQSAIECNWSLWISEAQQLEQAGVWQESRGPFDTTLDADFNRLWRENAQDIDRKTNRDGRRTDWNVGLRKRFLSGTEVSGSLSQFKEVDPTEFIPRKNEYTWEITLRQPILRDFLCGELHTAVQAEWNRYTAASWQFVHDASLTLFSVAQGYWQLYFRQHIVHVREATIIELEKLENATERLVEMDRIPNSQLFQQKAEIASETRNLCEAEQALQEAWLNLLVLMGIDPSCGCNEEIPLARNCPSALTLTNCSCEESVWLGLTHRNDLKADQMRSEALSNEVAGSENALLPELDLITSMGQVNHELGRDAAPFFSSFGAKNPEQNYLVGVSFSIPLWNRQAKGRLQQKCSQLKQQRGAQELKAAEIAAGVRSAVSEAEYRKCQLEAAREAVNWFQKAKESEIERWEAGYSTLFVVLDFIRREANAKISLAFAEAAYGNAYIDYLYQTGTWVTSDPCFNTLDVTVIGDPQ